MEIQKQSAINSNRYVIASSNFEIILVLTCITLFFMKISLFTKAKGLKIGK